MSVIIVYECLRQIYGSRGLHGEMQFQFLPEKFVYIIRGFRLPSLICVCSLIVLSPREQNYHAFTAMHDIGNRFRFIT